MASIAKYTPAGIKVRRDLLANGQKIVLKSFRISDKEIDLSLENTVDDIPDSWIEKEITSYKTIDDNKILFTLNVKRDEAVLEGRSFALYLDDGTAYIVGVPEAVFNRGMEQTYQVLLKVVNNSAREMELDFEYIHNEEHTETFLNISNGVSNLSSSIMGLFRKIRDIRADIIKVREENENHEELNRLSFLNISNGVSNLSSSIMGLFRKMQSNKKDSDEQFLTLAIAITIANYHAVTRVIKLREVK